MANTKLAWEGSLCHAHNTPSDTINDPETFRIVPYNGRNMHSQGGFGYIIWVTSQIRKNIKENSIEENRGIHWWEPNNFPHIKCGKLPS